MTAFEHAEKLEEEKLRAKAATNPPPPAGYDSWLDYAVANCDRAPYIQTSLELYNLRAVEQAVVEFCEQQKWADESWRQQPHIKALFDIAARATERGKR